MVRHQGYLDVQRDAATPTTFRPYPFASLRVRLYPASHPSHLRHLPQVNVATTGLLSLLGVWQYSQGACEYCDVNHKRWAEVPAIMCRDKLLLLL